MFSALKMFWFWEWCICVGSKGFKCSFSFAMFWFSSVFPECAESERDASCFRLWDSICGLCFILRMFSMLRVLSLEWLRIVCGY